MQRSGPPRPVIAGALIALFLLPAHSAEADPGFAMHLEGSGARMVGERKVDQFGWGGGGWVAPELTLGSRIGLELAVGALALAEGDLMEPGLADSGDGYSLLAMPGVRLRPLGRAAAHDSTFTAGGLWIAGGGGLAYTGDLARPAVGIRLGYDLFADRAFRVGPSVGFLQIIETAASILPEDARMVMFGFHAAYERPTHTTHTARPRQHDDDWDKDGIKNPVDRCPREPEDFDGFEDGDGCPDLDNDRDGIPDKKDRCPDDPEDKDGFEDHDGCPDLDNDKDGIPDKKDDCPDDPETKNGYADEDGCPDEEHVRVVGNEIVLDERVYFRVNMAEIQIRSWPLLQKVAKLLDANPQYTLVRVQGHADDTGPSDYNLRLSIRRSEAVRDMLVRFGVDSKRLKVEGYGERRPQQEGTTVGARRKNRRVEFLILARKEIRTYSTTPPAGKPVPEDQPPPNRGKP